MLWQLEKLQFTERNEVRKYIKSPKLFGKREERRNDHYWQNEVTEERMGKDV